MGLALIWAAALLSVVPAARAQHVRAVVSADSITVGDRFFLTLVAEHNFSVEPVFPAVDSTVFGDLEVLAPHDSGGRYLGASNPGVRVDSVVYEVTTFALDSARVPAIPIDFAANEDTFSVATAPFVVPVTSLVPADAAEIRDLAPLVEFPRPLWPYVLLALAVLTLVGTLLYYLRERRRVEDAEPAAAPPPPLESPYETALKRLRTLEAETPFDTPEAAKPFYIEVSDVLRTYLEHRLGVPALERTTRELSQEFERRTVRHRLPADTPRRIRAVLEQADLVKFADVRPSPPENRHILEETRTVLDLVEAKLRQLAPAPSEATPEPEPAS